MTVSFSDWINEDVNMKYEFSSKLCGFSSHYCCVFMRCHPDIEWLTIRLEGAYDSNSLEFPFTPTISQWPILNPEGCMSLCQGLSATKPGKDAGGPLYTLHAVRWPPFQHIGHFGMGLCSWRSGLTRNGDNSQPLHIMNSWDHRTNGCRPSSWYSHIHKIYVYIVGHHKADDCDTSLVSSQTTKSSVKLWQVGTGCSRWSVW